MVLNWSFYFTVSRFTSQLIPLLTSCVVTRSTVKGVNREASQSAFFKLMARGVPQLTALSGHHQLKMWVCNNVFADFTTTPHPASADSCCSTTPISPEEADIAHYIGGFVVSKLKQRSSASDYLQVLDTFVSPMEPAHGTLLGAKSRGRLTNLTKDAQSIFVELEQVFCALFPSEAVQIDVGQYKAACTKNQVVQDCYHSATDHLDQQNKGKILLDVICLYFKVRVHHKCKVLIERARSQKRTAKQDRALRSKLAK